MPKYYFDVENGRCTSDIGGIDLRDNAAAEQEALRVLLDAATEVVREDSRPSHALPVTVTMRNGSRKPVFKATLSIAMDRMDLP